VRGVGTLYGAAKAADFVELDLGNPRPAQVRHILNENRYPDIS
jgi:hypothetical protein